MLWKSTYSLENTYFSIIQIIEYRTYQNDDEYEKNHTEQDEENEGCDSCSADFFIWIRDYYRIKCVVTTSFQYLAAIHTTWYRICYVDAHL